MKKGNTIALLPIGVFLVIYLGLGIVFEYVLKISMGFYKIPIVVAFLVALLVACLQNRTLSFDKKLELMGKGIGDKNIVTMILIFMAAGIFVGVVGRSSAESVAYFLLSIIPPKYSVAVLFVKLVEKGVISYGASRITMWHDPWLDMSDSGYQMVQSLIAIGSGGLLGLGLGKGRQKFLYLPEEHNDFIFAVVCEELGLIGACVIMLIFALLLLRGFWIALHARDRFGTLLVVGIMAHLGLQVFLNIAVVTGLVPATGISLPFFSYGGTALALQLVEMGIVLSVSRQIPAPRNG